MKKIARLAVLLSFSAFARGRIQNEDVKSLVEIQSGAQATTGTLTSGSACISLVGTTVNIAVGQFIYDQTTSGNVLSGTTVAGLPGTCAAGQIKMSVNAAGNGSGDTLGFGGQMSQLTNDTKIYITANGLNEQLSTAIANNAFAGVGANSSALIANAGLTTTLTGASTLILTLTTASSGVPSVGNPVVPYFRNVSLVGAAFAPVNITSTLTLTLPVNGRIGLPPPGSVGLGTAANIWVYFLNDGGTADLCVTGVTPLDDAGFAVNPAQVAVGGNTAGQLYCANTHSAGSYSIRLAFRINTALTLSSGSDYTWRGPINETALNTTSPVNKPVITPWVAYTPTFSNAASTASPSYFYYWRRVGDTMEIHGETRFTSFGTTGSGTYTWSLPSGFTVDTNKQTTSGTIAATCGPGYVRSGTSIQADGITYLTDTTHFALFVQDPAAFANGHNSVSSTFLSTNPAGGTGGNYMHICRVPILGWN